MKLNKFNKFGLTEKDFYFDICMFNDDRNTFKKGIKCSIRKLGLAVISFNRKSQKQNRDRCLRMLYKILESGIE